jgi:cyclic pyranopterin phosphate synthase
LPEPSRPAPPAGSLPHPSPRDLAERNTRLVDAFGRRLTYLRVSVTDRCNLRCTYCLPEDADFPFGDRDFLSPDEIESIVGSLVRLGIRRVRLTGGEPLVRKDIVEIVRRVKALGVDDLSMTTNGTELARLAVPLREAGLDRVNVSVDTLDEEHFRAITRRGDLKEVWRGIEAALAAGLQPVKLNAVLLAKGNLTDLEDLAALTLDRPFHGRYIERLPTGVNQGQQADEFISADEAKERLEHRFGALEPVAEGERAPRTGPATAFRFQNAPGTIGFITPLSHTFCADCNRLRLTARGELRLCLFADRTFPLRPLLAAPNPEAALEAEILRLLQDKPAEHMLQSGNYGNLASFMQIGG